MFQILVFKLNILLLLLLLLLKIVYKKSYNTGKLPDDWKSANVVPVFKKRNTSLAANYRLIFLTCVSCKIVEHIITSNVMRHASTHNIL